jgi:hypothetical protein
MEDLESNSEESGFEIEIREDEYKFMTFVYSNSAMLARKAMVGMLQPDLKKTNHMLKVVKDKKPLLIENALSIDLPPKHYPLHNCLFVPVRKMKLKFFRLL